MNSTPDIYFPNLGISIEHMDRVAFTIFGFDVYKYGAIICFGVILGIALVIYRAKRSGQDPDMYTDYVFWGILFGVLGARCYYMIFHAGTLKGFFEIRSGGLAIYGGIIGAVLALIVYTRIKKYPLLLFTDTAVTSLVLGQLIGRWGNFANREAFGGPTESLFTMAYKASQVPGLEITDSTSALYNGYAVYPLHNLNGTDYIWVHPTFLYESCWNLLLLILLLVLSRHKKFDGQLTAIYFIGYGIGRFIIESMRTDQLLIFGIPVSMLLSAILTAAGICFMIYKLLKLNTNT